MCFVLILIDSTKLSDCLLTLTSAAPQAAPLPPRYVAEDIALTVGDIKDDKQNIGAHYSADAFHVVSYVSSDEPMSSATRRGGEGTAYGAAEVSGSKQSF